MSSLEVGQKYGELKDKRKWILPPLASQEARQQAGVFKMARGSWRAFAILRFGWRAALTGVVLSYLAAGIPILQGYGATETCIVSANRPDNNHVGSVGIPFDGIEIKIAEDGEILVRGPNVMRGYYGQPEATAEVLKDGWFYTGDVGYLAKMVISTSPTVRKICSSSPTESMSRHS